ncbi:NmrA/HSCARG family protein [Arthrobacter sp. CAN_A1]|uniref:NmrA/HSCARG family protein n=1 Tax=Arthrobacter sp. CAN_A1 TaxID=2787717 RepID=UPI0018C94279
MTDAMPRLIAVFGATGQQGGAVVDALLNAGATVRALVRQPESAKALALAGRGVELAHADVTDTATLEAALTGVDAFFFMTTPGWSADGLEKETAQGIALAAAAASVGVPLTVFSSVGGAERNSGIPHFESKRRVEEHIEQLGLNATIVRPVFFIDNFTFTGPSIENREVVVRLPLPDGIPLQMIAVRDVGRVAAATLLGAEIPGGSIEIAGDERTGTEIATAIGQKMNLPARYEALPVDVLGDNEDSKAMFRWFANLPAYRADLTGTRRIVPDALDLPGWLEVTGWTPSA